jgi:hypothetical protein
VVVVSFASVDDMRDRSRGEITTATHPFLQRELNAATAAIQRECGWHVAPVEERVFRRVSRVPSLVFIPASKILDVTAVRLNGYEIDAESVEFDPETGETNMFARAVELTYVAGHSPVPDDLMLLTLELAAGGVGADNILRESAAGVSVTLARTSSSLLPDDAPRLAGYRLAWLP